MTTGAIIMMIFGLSITWGGAAFCIYRAIKSK
ncbi:MAG: MetS family NSS transporter small subunit [Psychromonas sp.]|nr:MetS family NSS transporter small subunit [Psychromonas sp.]